MVRPEPLTRNEPLVWSPGRGTDVWAMLEAARDGDVATLERLLDADPSLIRCHYEYRTPLSFAVRENRVDAAELLLDRGAREFHDALETARDRGYDEMAAMLERKLAVLRGVSPGGEAVAEALRARDLDRVRGLLDGDPDLVHAADRFGNRPIHWAVMTRHSEAIDLLLERGADLEARRPDGARPIQLTNGDYHYRGWRDAPEDVASTPREILDRLRERGASVDLCTAAYIGDIDRVRTLLAEDPGLANRSDEYVTWYACSGTPLRNAAAAGHLEIVRLLLESGADPNLPEEGIAPFGHALHAAVVNGHRDIVELLLERGARPNVEVESSADTLSAAVRSGDDGMVALLCAYGASSPVPLLSYYDDLRTAAAVFAANPELADDREALANAAGEAFVRLVLRYAPDLPKRETVVGRTPAIARLLLERGMDPSRGNWLGITPLHELAGRGDVENATPFLEAGADPDAVDEEWRSTPLGWAARRGQAEMVELLIEHGADPRLPAGPGWARPVEWARRRGHEEIARRLSGA